MLTAARLGLRVPQDLSITGFDDAATAASLGLTTVRQPNRAKGELATEALLQQLERPAAPRVKQLPTEPIIRRSTGPPPSSQ
jgi:DNA-binding LacI/PurR family transcriptional regulator